MSASDEPVIVVGAGWSGIASAVALVERGHDVHVLEAAATVGGRARRTGLGDTDLDNGQHLLLGAYRQTLGLLARVGVGESAVLERRPFGLTMMGEDPPFVLRAGAGPGPMGLVTGLARARGVGRATRSRALAAAPLLGWPPRSGCDAESWLAGNGQPEALRRRLWRPLCLAALNVPTERASARVFARVLREAFAHRHSSDLLLPRTNLSALLPEPGVRWLRQHGARVTLGERVRSLQSSRDGWRVRTRTREYAGRDVVLACDPRGTARLLPDDSASARLAARLRGLGQEPITTVYLRYPGAARLEEPMVGRLDGPAQWLFDRRLTGHPGVIAAVISGRGPHEGWPRADLGAAVQRQLASTYPDWPAPEAIHVVREKRATFECGPCSENQRVSVRAPRTGLWLAGDHVATGLPATLEGAVRAGQACADTLAREREIPP